MYSHVYNDTHIRRYKVSKSFLDLKRNRQTAIEDIKRKLDEQSSAQSSFDKDPRYWQLVVDKSGNGLAIIRFLPTPADEDLPFVRKFSHSFKGPGGWYIEKSRTTLGEKDPVGEANSKLWETGDEEKRKIARNRKRRLGFISNILVLKHAARPEDEGKVFLYEYGKKIFDKINDKMMPPEELGDAPMNPFDFWDGADFILKIKKVSDFRNYDDSTFKAPSQLFGGDETELERIYGSLHSLTTEIAADKFKSYEELERKFLKVTGQDEAPARREKDRSDGKLLEKAGAGVDAEDEPETVGEDGAEDPQDFFARIVNKK